ncbi:MAG TPA: glycosyltransferase family A protein [Acidimicrobiales bacterium]
MSEQICANVFLTDNLPRADPDVSVIVTTRNHGQYLGDTLTAVAGQEAVNLELIVVDDASTDATESVARAFAARTAIPFTYARLSSHGGQAVGRNHGIDLARGTFLAFTDADCVPCSRWLCRALAAFDGRPSLGMVQGRTECHEERPGMFTHFIETHRFDGSFSTSNIVYRRAAFGRHRFDPSCAYWEDTDLGFRVRSDGWDVDFARDALVYHQVVPQSVGTWLMWPRRYVNWPAKVARYPEFRRTLFLKTWVRPLHACFDLALGGVIAMMLGHRRLAVLMCIPYAVGFACARGVGGRAPLMKVILHAARDIVASATLLAGSIRYRRVVL